MDAAKVLLSGGSYCTQFHSFKDGYRRRAGVHHLRCYSVLHPKNNLDKGVLEAMVSAL